MATNMAPVDIGGKGPIRPVNITVIKGVRSPLLRVRWYKDDPQDFTGYSGTVYLWKGNILKLTIDDQARFTFYDPALLVEHEPNVEFQFKTTDFVDNSLDFGTYDYTVILSPGTGTGTEETDDVLLSWGEVKYAAAQKAQR